MISKTISNDQSRQFGWSRPLSEQEALQFASSQDAPGIRTIALKVLLYALLDRIEESERTGAPGEVIKLHLADEVRRFESAIIRSALILTRGRQRPAARLLGMKSTTMHAKIRRYKIDLNEISRQTSGSGKSVSFSGKEVADSDWHGAGIARLN